MCVHLFFRHERRARQPTRPLTQPKPGRAVYLQKSQSAALPTPHLLSARFVPAVPAGKRYGRTLPLPHARAAGCVRWCKYVYGGGHHMNMRLSGNNGGQSVAAPGGPQLAPTLLPRQAPKHPLQPGASISSITGTSREGLLAPCVVRFAAAASARCKFHILVSFADHRRLVKRDPVLDPVAKQLKDRARVRLIVPHKLVTTQEATVGVLQRLREVPVVCRS